MRLDKLQVSGFGHLSGLDLQMEGRVTVLYGPNEAGKSTLLGFVRAMLFGIPARTYGPLRYEPIRGGAHGGQLSLLDEEGDHWVIERYAQPPEGRTPGMRGERLRITRTNREGSLFEVTPDEMQRELLGGMSSDMFKQLFAISLTELQEVAALQSDELSRFLFYAGIGGGTAVLRGEKKIVQEMDKLYRPRGRTQVMAQLLQGYERLKQEAEAASLLLPRYNEVLEALEQTMLELDRCEAERGECGEELAKLKKAWLIRGDWLDREKLQMELESLPIYEAFPEQGYARWIALQEDKERLLLEQVDLTRRVDAIVEEINRLTPNRRLLARAEAVRMLHGQLTGYETRLKEITALEAEEQTLRQRLVHCLRSIDAHWTEQELASFAGTVGEREAVRQFGMRFSAYDKEMELLQNERYKLEQEAAAAEEAYSAAMSRLEQSAETGRREFAMIAPKHPDEIRRTWGELRLELERWHEATSFRLNETRDREAEVLANRQVQGLYRKLLVGCAALTIALPGAIWISLGSLWGALATLAVLAGMDVYLWFGLKQTSKTKRQGHARRYPGEDELSRGEARLRGLFAKLVSDPLTAAGREPRTSSSSEYLEEWERKERELRQLMEQWQLWEQRHAALTEETALFCQRAAAAVNRCEHSGREMARREAQFRELAQEWEQWLQIRQLSSSLSPEAALDVFRLVEQGREWQSRLEQLSVRLSMLNAENAAFQEEVMELSNDLDSALDSEASEQGAALADHHKATYGRLILEAISQLSIAEKTLAQRELNSSKLDALKEERERLRDRLSRLEELERSLLAEGNAANGEEFLRRSAAVSRRAELETEIRQLETVMFSGLEPAKQSQLEELLSSCSEEELQRQLTAAQKAIEAKERAWRELQERKGRLLQERESLEQRGKQLDVNQQLAEQEAALQEILDKYAVMAVSQELISRVRRVYEEERQPEVLKLASSYLRQMTDGRYERIVLKMGSQELQAEHSDYGPIGSTALSRGTAEQLYLSMRLALAEAVSHHRSIPILLDDLFVNFDANRLHGVISVLKEVASKRQIVMMTCHSHVVEGILAQIPKAQIVNLA
ncbi:AAA family ATPase [Paenibacillus lentus]|uniref:YhaN AAA domain-containing protein n=1 Tax=Paenibacillus lentus TaxID=1338368 RepID=A0A3Q8SD69_9BACL|nr:AAA family ATPase [Paenibacillus lentus]AZK47985.1 hypothetical protein EIM92_18935 [Paenibacillus lentus]